MKITPSGVCAAFVLTAFAGVVAGRGQAQEPQAGTRDSTGAAAPSAATPVERQRATPAPNTFYYVSGDTLVKVEETPVEADMSVGAGAIAGAALGFGGGPKHWLVLAGTTSELRITEAQPRFRMACERALALTLRLGAFEVKGEKRRSQAEPGKLDVYKKPVKIAVSKVGEGVYDFAPEKPLSPGEYAFTVGFGTPVADFTIVATDGKEGENKR